MTVIQLRFIPLLIFVLTGLVSQNSTAQSLPQWEVGAGMIGLHVPHYRGADEAKTYIIPYPYLIYRGERFSLDEKGVKSWLFQSEYVELDFSLAAGLPVSSEENSARSGMPRLNPTVEFGPSIEIALWRAKKAKRSLWLNLPLRAMYSLDFPNLPYEGWIFAPYIQLNLAHYNHDYWQSSLSFGPMYASADYHQHYYGIDPAYATFTRPTYAGETGYSGSRLIISLRKQFGNVLLVAFSRYDNLNGASFEQSALVKNKNYQVVGVTLSWIFKKSSKRTHVH